jgi:ATP-dependent Zn protease
MDNRGRDWWLPVITLVLTEIDRLRGSGRKILLLGATNYYEHLDAALIRPGRLQQRVSVLPPTTQDEVQALFFHFLGDDLSKTEQRKLAGIAIGATPATVEGWVKAGRSNARLAARALTARDLLDQMAPADDRSEADLRTTALHELGHAIVAADLGHAVKRISILAGAGTGGHTATQLVSTVPTLQQIHDLVTICLAGRAADIVLGTGPHMGAESDLAHATELLLSARVRQGLGNTLVTLPSLAVSAQVMKEVDAEMHHLLQRAIAIVRKYRTELLRLAEQLLQQRIMAGNDVLTAVQQRAARKHSKSPGGPTESAEIAIGSASSKTGSLHTQ